MIHGAFSFTAFILAGATLGSVGCYLQIWRLGAVLFRLNTFSKGPEFVPMFLQMCEDHCLVGGSQLYSSHWFVVSGESVDIAHYN